MKIRILDRILVFLAGVLLIAAGAAVVAGIFWDIPVADFFESLQGKSTVAIAAACVLALLGVYCMGMMFRRYKGKRGFVVQRTEGGELSISIKAIENLVQKCIDKHEELHVLSTGLENSRDGLVIKLRIGLASGVSIPLVVSALQKQIKQYITACSGIDVLEVKVQVETASASLKASPYAVPDMLATPVTEKLASATQEPAAVNSAVSLVPPDTEPVEKRPLHQRIFGREEQAMDVPVPPKAESAEAAAPAEPAATQAEPSEKERPEAEPAEAAEAASADAAGTESDAAEAAAAEASDAAEEPDAAEGAGAAEREEEPAPALENGFPAPMPEEKEEERHEAAQ